MNFKPQFLLNHPNLKQRAVYSQHQNLPPTDQTNKILAIRVRINQIQEQSAVHVNMTKHSFMRTVK